MKKLSVLRRNYTLLLLPLLLLAGCGNQQEEEQMAFPPAEVVAFQVESQEVTLSTALPGRTTAYRYAEVRPQVSGIVIKRLFEEGAEVSEGESLYQIDDQLYRAALAVQQANLATAEAALESAELRYQRYTQVIGSNGVSQQDLDEAEIALNQAKANMASAEAQLHQAEINLEYTQVRAPISGRIGRSSVTEGALVTAQQATSLALIQQLDPIYVDVSKSAQEMLDLRLQIQSGQVVAMEPAEVTISLENGMDYPHKGRVASSEVLVSETTGSVILRAVVPNPEQILLPGMYVHTEIAEGVQPRAILIPQQSLMRDRTGGAMVYLINAENMIEARPVTADRAIGDKWLVSEGLAAGDRIVLEGIQKVQPGAPVSPVMAGTQE